MRIFASLATAFVLLGGCAHHRLGQNRPTAIETIEITGTVIRVEEGEIVPVGKTPAYPYTTCIVLLAESPPEGGKKELCFEVFQHQKSDCARLRGRAVKIRIPKEPFEQSVRRFYEEGISIEEVSEAADPAAGDGLRSKPHQPTGAARL